MATELQQKPVAKFESFVEEQLGRVRGRIRALDIGASVLLLLAVVLAYLLAMGAFELWAGSGEQGWITAVRYGAFGVFVAVGLLLAWQIGLKCYRRINPYFAARRLEENLPDAKNSVINWLDLRDEPLPGAIRQAVGLKAARDLKRADPEKVVETKTNWLLGGVLAGLVLGVLILFAMRPGGFVAFLGRAFAPFRGAPLTPRTTITMIRPAEGNAVISLNQRIEIRAQIDGRFPKANHPDAPTLHLRYQPGDPYVRRPLEEDGDGTWAATVLADQVQNGFWYKLSAGDGQTEEFQVQVRSLPRAVKFEVCYRYRPYRKLADETIPFPNERAVHPRIHGHRGTDIELVVRANRKLREGLVELEIGGQKQAAKTELAEDAQTLRARFTLEKSGLFRVLFTSEDGEENSDRSPYTIDVIEDGKPSVVLTKPAEDVSLPANGFLPLEGKATDDFGVKSMTLRLQVLEGPDKPALAAKPYRPGKSFAFDNGTYPPIIEYQDVLGLDQLTTDKGKPFRPAPKTVIEYWLEALDNSDFPEKDGNLGKSQVFKITILDPDQKKTQEERKQDDEKQKKERKQADDQQKKHEKNQDSNHAQDNEQRNQQGDDKEQSPEDKQRKQDLENKLKDPAKKLQEQIDKQKQEQADRDKGEAKPQEPPKAENKPGPDQKAEPGQNKDQKPSDPGQTGDKKDEGQRKDGQNAQAKDKGPKEDKGKDNQPGEAKGGGPEKDQTKAKGGDGNNDPKEQPNAQAKGGGPKDQPPDAKDKGGADAKPERAQTKENPDGGEPQAGVAKGGDPKGEKAQAKEAPGGDPKEGPAATAKDKGAGPGGKGPQTDAKNADPKQADDSALARNDEPQKGADPKAQKGADPKAKEPTLEDIAKWKEELKRKDQAEETAEELSRAAKDAKDDKVKQAAKEVLEKAGRDPDNPHNQAKSGKGPDEPEKKKGPPDEGMGTSEDKAPAQAKSGDPKDAGKGKGNEEDVKDPDYKKHAKSGNKGGHYGPGGQGIYNEPRPMDPTKGFADRPGDLQLENLKNRVNPKVLKNAGLTEKDWQQFLKDAEAYEKLLRKEQRAAKNDPTHTKGQASKIGSRSVQPLGANPNAQFDPLQAGRALPPPEFRDAQENFTKRPSKQ